MQGSPSWFRPWTWGEYDVFPEVAYVALPGLAAASAFVRLVQLRRPVSAAGLLAVSVVLLAYPFFAGLTPTGRVTFAFGPILALGSLAGLAWNDGGRRRNFTSGL